MPLFLYENPKTKEVKEVIQSVHDKHEYSEDGVKWNRVFTVPQASIDSKVPVTSQEFVNKSKTKKGNMGNLFDAAKEASLKRKEIYGKDPVREEYFKNYAKARKGKMHPAYYED